MGDFCELVSCTKYPRAQIHLNIAVIDAWGKIPSGILYGNTYELGQFDECLAIEKPADNENPYILKGQYCLTQLSIGGDSAPSQIFDEIGNNRQLKKDNKFKGAGAARMMPIQESGFEFSFVFSLVKINFKF